MNKGVSGCARIDTMNTYLEPVAWLVAVRQKSDARQRRRDVEDADDVTDEALLTLEVWSPDAAAGVEYEHDVCRLGVTAWR